MRKHPPLNNKNPEVKSGNGRFFVLIVVTVALFFLLGGKLLLDAAYVPVIIMYHSVGEEGMTLDGYGGKLNVSVSAFEKQMKFLHEQKFKVIPLAEFIERIKTGKRIPHRTIAITFDDGLKDNFTNAYPILKKYNFPATIFIATDFIGKRNFLDVGNIKTMQKNNITIGSHTMSHRWLPWQEEPSIREELFDSKKKLEDITNRKIDFLSYPLGKFNDKIKEIAKEAGYIGAVTTSPGKKEANDDIYALKRIRISMTSNNLFVFWIETSGYYTFIKERRDDD